MISIKNDVASQYFLLGNITIFFLSVCDFYSREITLCNSWNMEYGIPIAGIINSLFIKPKKKEKVVRYFSSFLLNKRHLCNILDVFPLGTRSSPYGADKF